jgi:hypothetical protein
MHPVPTPAQLADYRAAGARIVVLDRGGGEPAEPLTEAELDESARWAVDTAPPAPAVPLSARFTPRTLETTQ